MMQSFNFFDILPPLINLATETGNFFSNIVALVLRVLGIQLRFF